MSVSRSQALLAALALALAVLVAPPAALAKRPTPLAQFASLTVLPQLADPGTSPRPAAAALSTLEAGFSPPTQGRVVLLQALRGRTWSSVDRALQDAAGTVRFNAPYAIAGAPATYRVVAARTPRLPEKSSVIVSTARWGTPILSDEFSGTSLAQPWDQRQQGYEVAGRSCSRTDASAATVAGGMLSLSVLDDPGRDDTCTYVDAGTQRSTFYRLNGHVGTQGRFSYKYGVAAARVRFQDTRGQHGAFWMQPAGSGAGAEIDVIEWFGNGSGGLANTVWDYGSGTPVRVAGGFVPDQPSFGSDWADSFHVFSVEWTPTEYVFRIDGKVSLRTSNGVSQTEEYLILSLLVSNWEARNLPSPSVLPQTMDVDWVRVWAPA